MKSMMYLSDQKVTKMFDIVRNYSIKSSNVCQTADWSYQQHTIFECDIELRVLLISFVDSAWNWMQEADQAQRHTLNTFILTFYRHLTCTLTITLSCRELLNCGTMIVKVLGSGHWIEAFDEPVWVSSFHVQVLQGYHCSFGLWLHKKALFMDHQ